MIHGQRKLRIVATVGPSGSDQGTVRALLDAWADVFRHNFSHGTHAQHQERIEIIRRVARDTGRPIAVLLDQQGPKLRIGTLTDGTVAMRASLSR
jgi:pyruvate kinase